MSDSKPGDLKPIGVKPPFWLLPLRLLTGVSRVLEHGAAKYAPWNWATPKSTAEQTAEYASAHLRHVADMQNDPAHIDESGIPSIDHAITNLLILRYHLVGLGLLPTDPGRHVTLPVEKPVEPRTNNEEAMRFFNLPRGLIL